MRNLVKRKLKAGKPSVGTWISIGHPDVSMYLADLGFDWLVCDMEHGPFGPETYHFMAQAMLYNRESCMPMARIPWNDLIWAKKALNAGATGLVTPRVEPPRWRGSRYASRSTLPWGRGGPAPG